MRETEEPYTLLHLQFHIYKSIIFSYRCLHKTGGSLQFRTEKCIKIIECCFRLHNKAISERVPLQAGNNAVPVYHNHDLYNGNDNDGFALRQRIVQRF